MRVVDLSKLGDEFVFHFGGEYHQIKAETFANTLLELSGALKEINRVVNPDFEIEVYIDSLGRGSFRARIKMLSKKAAPLLVGVSKTIILPLLAAWIYDKIIADDIEIKITVDDDYYIVENGDQRILLPREVAEIKQKISENPEVEKRVSKAFKALEDDPRISDFGITENLDDEEPAIKFGRSDFARLSEIREYILTEDRRRTKDEAADLMIIRAIFKRGPRKWEFVWKDGITISAPVLDEEFYDKLISHEYVIGTGDTLQVILRIHQHRDEMSDIWINERYEVLRVLNHTPGPRQPGLFGPSQ